MSEWGPKLVGAPAYSRDEFFLDSRDKKGFSTTLRVNIPPGLMQQIIELVESKRFPYRTKADVYRDAIMHLLKYRGDQDPDPAVARRIEGLLARERAVRIVETREEFNEFKERMGAGLTVANEGERVRIAKEMLEYADKLGDGYGTEMRGFLGGRGL